MPAMEGGFVAALERWIPASLLADTDLRRRALMAVGIAWSVLVLGVALTAFVFALWPAETRWISTLGTLVTCALAGVTIVFVRRGRLILAGHWIAALITVGVITSLAISGNVGAPFTATLPIAPLLAAVIAGRRAGVAWALIASAAVLVLFALGLAGAPLPNITPPESELALATLAALSAIAIAMWVTSFSESLKERAIRQVEEAASRLDRALAEEEKAKIAAEQAIAANAAKGAFLATMSHELRTPLNVILGYAEVMEEELGPQRLGEHLESVARIRASGNHLLGLISDILDLAKIEAGRLELRPEPFDVAALVIELGATFEPLARKKGDRIDVVAPEPLPVVLDRTRVRQILVNLVGNAIKFTDDGVIVIAAARRQDGPRAWVDVSISDTGIGIDDAKVTSIFDSFVQADSSSTRAHEGSGLGLAIVRKLCEMMGARIALRSRVGAGTTIEVSLPAAPGPTAP